MKIQEKLTSMIIDVQGSTKTTRYTFAQDSFGRKILDTKKTFDNVDFDLKVNQSTKIKLPLDIKASEDVTKTIIGNFTLKEVGSSNLFASVNFSKAVNFSKLKRE